MKLDWRSLAKSSQTCTSLQCTGLSGVHRTVSGAQTGSAAKSLLSGIGDGAVAKNHRTAWWSTGLSGEPSAPTPTIDNAISGRRVARANSHQAAPDYPVCTRQCPVCQGVPHLLRGTRLGARLVFLYLLPTHLVLRKGKCELYHASLGG
jgi:hypothetical protein